MLETGSDRGRRQRCRVGGRGFRDAATLATAGAALADCARHAGGLRRPGGSHLRPDEQQAEENGRRVLHGEREPGRNRVPTPILAFANYFLAFFSAASSFLIYLAGSFLKSFRQDLQHILISRPSWVKT